MKPKQLFDLCRKAVMAWIDDYAPSMGAALAYYTLFSIAPLLVIVIAIAGFVLGPKQRRGRSSVSSGASSVTKGRLPYRACSGAQASLPAG